MADPGFGAAAISFVVNGLLQAVITAAKRAYRCKKNCKQLCDVLELVEPFVQDVVAQPSGVVRPAVRKWLDHLKGLLEEAEVLVQKCGALSSMWKQMVPAYRVSSKILDVTERIGKTCDRATLATLNVALSLYNRMSILEKFCKELKKERRLENVGIITREVVESVVRVGTDAFHDIKYQVDSVGWEGDLQSLDMNMDNHARFDELRNARKMQPVPEYVFGLDKVAEELKRLLLRGEDKDKARTVGVWGRGGAGKTLLAQIINNCEVIRNHYRDYVLWVTVGRDASIAALYKSMAEFLNVMVSHIASVEHVKTTLFNSFMKRKVLLILDDVWEGTNMLEWLDLAKSPGSVTLITTRTQSVLQKANAEEIVVMELCDGDSWKLFCAHAFHGVGNVPANLEGIAKKVARECGGLPLALKVVGGAMVGKKREGEWRVALRRLRDSQSLDPNMEVQLYHRLKMSYDELDVLDPRAKECFLYFAAFPEDAQIEVKQLFAYWIGEGLVGGNGDDPTDEAYVVLGLLIGRALINIGRWGCYCNIHDVLRDLALYIIQVNTKEEDRTCLFQAGKGLDEFPTNWCNTSLKARKLSLLNNDLRSIPDHIQALELRTLLLGTDHVKLAPSITLPSDVNVRTGSYITLSESFFSHLSQLQVLDLRALFMKLLPDSLGHLKFLVYLDLSNCLELEQLPNSIEHLHRLEHLDLLQCSKLGYVPLGVTKLPSLKYLNLDFCFKLQWHCGEQNTDERRASLEDLGLLSSMTEVFLSSSDKHSTCSQVPNSIFSSMEGLKRLDLDNLTVPDSMESIPNVEELSCFCCVGIRFPAWIEGCQNLIKLSFRDCETLKRLPALDTLPHLGILVIAMCECLEGIPQSFTRKDAFKSLKVFACVDCENLEYFPDFELPGAMPQLEVLELTPMKPNNLEEYARLQRMHKVSGDRWSNGKW